MIFILKCRPPFGTHFLQLDFAKCHDLKEPRVHAWLAVGHQNGVFDGQPKVDTCPKNLQKAADG